MALPNEKIQRINDSQSESKKLTASTKQSPSTPMSHKRNAFSELMSPKAKQQRQEPDTSTRNDNKSLLPSNPRSGLLPYITHPEDHPDMVLRVTEHTVLIRDLYPKATVHLLLLPRSEKHRNLHPHDAFADSEFLDMIRNEAKDAALLASSELARQIGPFSQSNSARNLALESESELVVPIDELPPGRDFSKDIRIGIHAHPSMSHLHIHIISRDMQSDCVKHRKHYNSFNTSFFIPLADYPLELGDERTRTRFQNENLKRDFECWRCGMVFGNKFARLKQHLAVEFNEWRRE